MIVSTASRMVSAISYAVFCLKKTNTNAIIRSTKDSPGLVVIFTTTRSESTVVPPVTADRSPPDSRMTGADSPVMADSSTVDALDDVAVARDHLPGFDHHEIADPQVDAGYLLLVAVLGQAPRDGLLLRPAQGFRLCLAAAFGDGLGEVREQHGEPEPDRDQDGEDGRIGDREDGGQQRADPHHEHHRVAQLVLRAQLAQRVRQGRP